MSVAPIEMLQIIRQHGNLTIPEFIARVGISPAELVDGLEKLESVGLVEIKDPEALPVLRQLATHVEEKYRESSSLVKRQEFFGLVAKDARPYRNVKLRPSALVA